MGDYCDLVDNTKLVLISAGALTRKGAGTRLIGDLVVYATEDQVLIDTVGRCWLEREKIWIYPTEGTEPQDLARALALPYLHREDWAKRVLGAKSLPNHLRASSLPSGFDFEGLRMQVLPPPSPRVVSFGIPAFDDLLDEGPGATLEAEPEEAEPEEAEPVLGWHAYEDALAHPGYEWFGYSDEDRKRQDWAYSVGTRAIQDGGKQFFPYWLPGTAGRPEDLAEARRAVERAWFRDNLTWKPLVGTLTGSQWYGLPREELRLAVPYLRRRGRPVLEVQGNGDSWSLYLNGEGISPTGRFASREAAKAAAAFEHVDTYIEHLLITPKED